MVINFEDIIPDEITAPRNGKGTAASMPYLAMKGLEGRFKTFNMMTLDPDSAIGFHKHENDSECYLLLEGRARYNDNGEEVTVEAGDLMYCGKGESHSIEALDGESVTFLAFILE